MYLRAPLRPGVVSLFDRGGINIFGREVDMTPMLGLAEYGGFKETSLASGTSRKRILALELLSGCGMILRAQLRTSPADERCHRPLTSRVHPSSVFCDNGLNLSRGSRV